MKTIFVLIARFRRADGGNLAVTFSLALLPVVGVVGASVDYSKANNIRTQMQSSLDAAVLAGVTQASGKQVSVASATFTTNYVGRWGTGATASFTVNADSSLTGSAHATVATSLMRMVGISSISVKVNAKAAINTTQTSNVCILLVDPTQSQSLLVNSGARCPGRRGNTDRSAGRSARCRTASGGRTFPATAGWSAA
jgi:Flp pilus assembly protein TadG